MEAKIKQVQTFTITLDIEEVRILKALTQNPYLYNTLEEEPKQERDFREQIWKVFRDIK